MQWFKFYQEFSTDPKVQMMCEAYQRRLVMILCNRCNENVTLHDNEVTFLLRISEQEWAETKAEFIKRGFIDCNGNVTNWEKRQTAPKSSAERVREHREKKKLLHVTTCNENVTDVTPLDKSRIEENREEKKESKKEAATPKIDFDFSVGKFVNLAPDKLVLWKEAYPAIDIPAEIRKAAIWLMENPKNKKSNYGKFLANWFSRAQDSAPKASPQSYREKPGFRMPSPAGG